MASLPRREYLANVGTGLALLSIGAGAAAAGRAAPGSTAEALGELQTPVSDDDPVQDVQVRDYERDESGAVEFDTGNVSFETDSEGVEFEFDGPLEIDFEADGDEVELTVTAGPDAFDFEYDRDGSLEFEAAGGDADTEFGPDERELEYEGPAIDFEWVEGEEVELDIEGAERGVSMEYDVESFEWTGLRLEFEWDGPDNEFEVSRADRSDPETGTETTDRETTESDGS